jgi:hypothetical protein
MIAVLFAEKNGIYSKFPFIDLWDKQRDARKYNGPYPVIAHPPCQKWGNLAYVNYKRWGGEHNKPGNDHGCFFSALASIKMYGGILEHPAHTHAWKIFALPKPKKGTWTKRVGCDVWTCEVWQSAYGHKANKATWLAYVGFQKPFDLNWDRPTGTHQIGGADYRGKEKNKPTLSKKESNATPEAFCEELIKLALYSNRVQKYFD